MPDRRRHRKAPQGWETRSNYWSGNANILKEPEKLWKGMERQHLWKLGTTEDMLNLPLKHGQVPTASQQARSHYRHLVLGGLSARGQTVLLGMLMMTCKNIQTKHCGNSTNTHVHIIEAEGCEKIHGVEVRWTPFFSRIKQDLTSPALNSTRTALSSSRKGHVCWRRGKYTWH